MQEVKIGFTNQKFIDGKKFIVKKTLTGFNHEIDYSILDQFSFVPKLIKSDSEYLEWELIEGKNIETFSNSELKELASNLKELHKSNLKFPKWNIRRRVTNYLKILTLKNMRVKEIDDNYREMKSLLKFMKLDTPSHNDVWNQNIMRGKNGKIWLVDWEYATMNDKHFDIAYFLMSQNLTKNERRYFLESYGIEDDRILKKYCRFVVWLTILWACAQEKMPFDLEHLKTYLNKIK